MPERLQLNAIKPAAGSRRRPRRVGRGNGSGHGTTCGRGYKGQKSRSGGYHKVNFEGGQMPINRRLPKIGFRSRKTRFACEVRLGAVNKLEATEIDPRVLRQQGLAPARARKLKLILSGKIERAVTVRGCAVTAGARAAIEAAGGTVE